MGRLMDNWTCDNCELDQHWHTHKDKESNWHMCRSNPESCVEGRECPDYRVGCSCSCGPLVYKETS